MDKHDKILLDANVLIAISRPRDPHHQRAFTLIEQLRAMKSQFITNNHVVDETLTVTVVREKSMMYSVKLGEHIYGQDVPWFRVYRTPLSWEKEAFDLFRSQKTYKKDQFLSFTDCVLLVQARRQKIKTIFSFDEVFKRFEKEGMKILS